MCDASISGDDRVELRAFGCKSGNDQLGVRGAIKIGDDTLCRASYEAIFSLSRALGKTVLSGWKTNQHRTGMLFPPCLKRFGKNLVSSLYTVP